MPLVITGGKWRGHPLKSPSKGALRPTAALLRKALFDKWGAQITESCLLDLFAGSGAISLEAISRGAHRAVAVESSPLSIKTLCENAFSFTCKETLQVVRKDVFRYLQQSDSVGVFDLAFADPPYALLSQLGLLETLMELTWPKVKLGGLLVLERAKRIAIKKDQLHWQHCATHIYGDSCLDTFERI